MACRYVVLVNERTSFTNLEAAKDYLKAIVNAGVFFVKVETEDC